MADADHPAADPPGALPRGTRLAEFELRRVLGSGGFGIVYLAFDHALEREVAVKEYMPSSLVGRDGSMAVSLLSQAYAESFSLGLRSFVNEARLLARFDHPSLVKVLRYWEANNTAYMAMPCYAGSNLHALRRGMALPPDEAWLRSLLEPLLGALERLHGEAVYHRDISPDNVILQPDGRPVLLDFGAARRVLGDKSMALTAILKPAYAPIEQYAEAGAVKQGPWTDLYSLGGTLHYLLLGRAPMPATTRTVMDEMPPLASQAAQLPGCTVGFLQCVDWMLQPRPADRPQHVAALRARLANLPPAPLVAAAPAADSEAWSRTLWLGGSAASHAPTVLDPSLTPVTVLAPPAPDTRPTLLMPRGEAGEADATVVMPHGGPRPAAIAIAAATAAVPLPLPLPVAVPGVVPGVATTAPAALVSAPRDAASLQAAVAGGRTEPTLEGGQTLTVGAPRGPNSPLLLRPPSPSPSPASPWILAVGALGLVSLALWWGMRPAAGPIETASAIPAAPASASFDAASAADEPPAAATATPPPPVATVATGREAGKTPTARAAPTAARSETTTTAAPPTRRPASPPTAPVAVATAAPARANLPPPPSVLPLPLPLPLPSPDVPSGAPPGLATSITRLPPAHAQATLSTPAASATLQTRAPPTAVPGAEATRPTAAALAGATPVTLPPMAVTSKTPTAAPARPPDRDAEPVLLQARALSPAERCEGRALAALWSCIERLCNAEPGLRDHRDCLKARREAEQRVTPSR